MFRPSSNARVICPSVRRYPYRTYGTVCADNPITVNMRRNVNLRHLVSTTIGRHLHCPAHRADASLWITIICHSLERRIFCPSLFFCLIPLCNDSVSLPRSLESTFGKASKRRFGRETSRLGHDHFLKELRIPLAIMLKLVLTSSIKNVMRKIHGFPVTVSLD